ncbi:MAG TPA: hypothetical protein VJ725_27285 [Thermoanaerobaculia bacterium]|nr:hypothetical protein [Thermoanaerobaculia bacterium]
MPPLSYYVSTFENLVKPIAPPAIPFVRTVISGYFCTFSNLGFLDQTFRFLVVIPRFVAPGAPGEGFEDRELTVSLAGSPQQDPSGIGNHNAIYDITGGPAQGQTAVGELQYLGATACSKIYISPLYSLCKGGSSQFALLPNLGPGPNLIANDVYEVRGWVAIGRYSSPNSGTTRLLVTPEQRGTFIPVDISDPVNDPVNLSDVSQLNTSLPTGTPAGGAFVELTPQANAVTPKVNNFAAVNGIPVALITPFSDLLDPIL